ncbi:MAG: pentapeptide repeat-containing protein [Elainellaceae cyanobacterium]
MTPDSQSNPSTSQPNASSDPTDDNQQPQSEPLGESSSDSSRDSSNGASQPLAVSDDANGPSDLPSQALINSHAESGHAESGVEAAKGRSDVISTTASPQLSTTATAPAALLIVILIAIAIMIAGLVTNLVWLSIAGSTVALLVSLRAVWSYLGNAIKDLLISGVGVLLVAVLGIASGLYGLFQISGVNRIIGNWYQTLDWEAIGALGDFFGAIGQILIAILAVYIAWRQYVISKDLTIQQNLITQQQTIDSYFQGISDLVLDAEGLLEDWPQERAIAEGRTAAILSSVDATGKAKIVRFLSRSRLLSPLKRDRHLGRAMLDGVGGYQEDRDFGIRVIDLGVMLAASHLAGTDLRWTELSDANLVRANLSYCDLVKANLARTILYDATLRGADLMGARLFYGTLEMAKPRTRHDIPDYETGAFTGAVIENADMTDVRRLSKDQRYYCCAWGGSKTRATIPGGCEGIPNKLNR